MLRNVLTKTLRDGQRGWVWWTLGLVAYIAVIVSFFPTLGDDPAYNEQVDNLPEGVWALFGGVQDISTPAGYLQTELFSLMLPGLVLIYAILLGTGAVAGEEERHTLDLLLANPVTRTRFVLEKAGGVALLLFGVTLVLWLGLWIGAQAVDMTIGAGKLLAATLGAGLLALLFGSLGLALGAVTGYRARSAGIAAAVAVVSYVVDVFGTVVGWLEPLRPISPFYHATGTNPLTSGFDAARFGHIALLLAIAAGLALYAAWSFNRRDLAR